MNKAPRYLSPWNPLDYLRLLWWALAAPARLRAYRETFGARGDRPVGRWLVVTLIWLPLAAPTFALAGGVLPRSGKAFPAAFYTATGAALLLASVLSAWLGNAVLVEAPTRITIRRGGAATLGAVLVLLFGAAIAAGAGIGGALERNVAFILTACICLAEGQAFIVADVLMRDDATGALGGATGFVALTVAVFTALGMAVDGRELLSGLAIAGAAIWTALRIAESAQRGLRAGRPTPPAQVTFGLLAATHALIICISFLGGWRLFR